MSVVAAVCQLQQGFHQAKALPGLHKEYTNTEVTSLPLASLGYMVQRLHKYGSELLPLGKSRLYDTKTTQICK